MVFQVLLAFLLDLLIGDSYPLHPVVLMGKLASLFEKRLQKIFKGLRGERLAGFFLLLLVGTLAFFIPFLLIKEASSINPYLGFTVSTWLISTTIATKSLRKAAYEVSSALRNGELKRARRLMKNLVSRDTASLSRKGVLRATIESVAENTVDGIVSPLFYAFLGGAPLAMFYRAVNTLDAMVGYKNERYLNFGWASAKFDDLLNFIPARINLFLTFLASWLIGKDAKKALRIGLRDGRKHASLNSGFSEAAFAGALGVQLGGRAVYQGKAGFHSYLGDPVYPLSFFHLREAVYLSSLCSYLFLFLGALLALIWKWLA